ncbi:tetratricopeptide repeat protein [Salinimicrobium gaetbulicola]|uniref:Tetratricopeptide repeat protein n=1 Tax=Salinimicrobium gaetbulicola TaxID=999702 RepID=A0ABW3ID01_9FLAO
MKSKINLPWYLSLIFIVFFISTNAQETDKASIGDVVYEEYQKNGIDKALAKYQKLKTNKADQYTWTEWELNRIGYRLMLDDKDMDAAQKVFKFNIEEYPNAANPYDSYADYLLEKGNKDEAKEYFKKSIAIAEKSEKEDEQTRIMAGSKSKLAKLEKKDRTFDFLVGDWNIDSQGFNEGKEGPQMKGKDKVTYDENANAFIIHHFGEDGNSEGIRVIAYDAIDDEYDVAYINPNNLQGIQVSSMKMKKLGDKKYEFMDHFTERTGEEVVLKHEIERISDNQMKWVIFEKTDNDDWQKVYAMNMSK